MSETLFDQLRDSVAELVDERRGEGGILDRGIERLESAINAETSLGGFIGEHFVSQEANQPPAERASKPVDQTPEAITTLTEAERKLYDLEEAERLINEALSDAPVDLLAQFDSRESDHV